MNYPDPVTGRRQALVSNVLKVFLAGGLLFWLGQSGGIRFEYLIVPAAKIPVLLAACMVVAVGMALAAPRYVVLLKGAGIDLSLKDSLRISAIMYFFTQCVLGAASGDVGRYFYTTRVTGHGAKVGAAIIVDRLVGIMGLFLFGGLGLAFNWTLVEHSGDLRLIAVPALGILCLLWLSALLGFVALARGRMAGFAVGLVFPVLAAFFSAYGDGFFAREVGPILLGAALVSLVAPLLAPELLENGFIYRKFFAGSKIGEKIGEVLSAILIYRSSVPAVLKIVGMTMLQHLTLIYSIYLFSQIQNLPVQPVFNEVFFAAPLSFLAGVIPAPAAGLGVNEAAFESLLFLGSGGSVSAGASIFLMYRIWNTLFSFSGLFFIVRAKK
ncbi:lysylphosphatidylglycerol synthase domain-containing protein [Maridesulfovibrio sp.]|uniref:lysylphosphatidylglycerol synthase domain-containing protein n=1 Tax=Maridesulfovibrio sp. TaxID=2795000 RepID=UPI0039EFB79B